MDQNAEVNHMVKVIVLKYTFNKGLKIATIYNRYQDISKMQQAAELNKERQQQKVVIVDLSNVYRKPAPIFHGSCLHFFSCKKR